MPRRASPLLPLLLLPLLGLQCPQVTLDPGTGVVPEDRVAARSEAYLEFATGAQTGSILNAIAHMERDLSDPDYTAPAGVVDENTWDDSWYQLDTLQDTRDFDGLYLLNALLGYEGHPYLTPAAWERVRQSLLSFKYWYTDPTPAQPDPTQPDRDWDESFYWTENHQILYHTLEYLAGQRFPDECFWIVGLEPATPACDGEPGEMTGSEHMERARGFIERWMDERWLAGYAEWHSNVYYQKDMTPLLTLVEYADDPEIATRAAILLDVILLDLATHTFETTLGVTHGRSDMKDKHRGPRNDTWGIALLLFGQQDALGHTSTGDAGATLFARAKKYRMPKPVLEAALSQRTFVDRMRMSYPIDERGPVVDDPVHPPGHSFEDTEANFTFWWGLGAWTVWQVVPLTLINGDRYNMWNMSLLAPFRDLRDFVFSFPDPIEAGKNVAQSLWPLASVGLLSEVNTYTYRTPDYILSTAQDYRKGANAGQVHAWQATFGSDALVFTTHPMESHLQRPPSRWIDVSGGEPGYWAGTASMPRSAQHENVGIHLYSPVYADGGVLGLFDYQAETHAYFPQDHFDAVVQAGGWTFANHDSQAYIALYSWRPTQWRDYPADEMALLPPSEDGPIVNSFDLVAPGGADNVWIVECARASDWPSFEAFRQAVADADVTVTSQASGVAGVQTFDVEYHSPSQGVVTFGWDAPFTVDGRAVSIDGYPRMHNPWAYQERGAPTLLFSGEDAVAVYDWTAGTRELSGVTLDP